jgi:hypothetical protein
VLSKLKSFAGKIAGPAWAAARLLLNNVLPGSPAVVELIQDTVEWAKGKHALPTATAKDLDRVEDVIRCLDGDDDLKAFLKKVAQLARGGHAGQETGYVQSSLGGDSLSRVVRDLDGLARGFDRLEQQNRALLEKQHYASAVLTQMLSLMQRLAGIADFVDELRMTGTKPADFGKLLEPFQAGTRLLVTGKPLQAEGEFKKLTAERPRSPGARIGLGTAQVAGAGSNQPRVARLILEMEGWASLQDSKALPRSFTQPDLKKLVIKSGIEHVTDAWLAYHLDGLNNLQTLSLWECAKVTDEGLAALTALPNLRTLHLRKCSQITDQAVGYFCKIPKLQELSLWGSKLTPSGVSALQAIKLTGLVIHQ